MKRLSMVITQWSELLNLLKNGRLHIERVVFPLQQLSYIIFDSVNIHVSLVYDKEHKSYFLSMIGYCEFFLTV